VAVARYVSSIATTIWWSIPVPVAFRRHSVTGCPPQQMAASPLARTGNATAEGDVHGRYARLGIGNERGLNHNCRAEGGMKTPPCRLLGRLVSSSLTGPPPVHRPLKSERKGHLFMRVSLPVSGPRVILLWKRCLPSSSGRG
jgi:hypothetical protein